MAFLDRLRADGRCQFHMEELRQWIGADAAPDSAGRILRLLRQRGVIDYKVANRAQSLYEIL